MRIIAGSAKGSRIFAPKGRETRPTQDRVRESLFNMLQRDVPDAVALDLFAGSGALSLEALSRGAAEAVLVDFAQDAVVCISRNLAKLGWEHRARVLKCDWQAAVARLAEEGKQFDLVFLDPPYPMTDTAGIMARLAADGLLGKGALVVTEHRKGAAPAAAPPFRLRCRRSYGDTEMTLLHYGEP